MPPAWRWGTSRWNVDGPSESRVEHGVAELRAAQGLVGDDEVSTHRRTSLVGRTAGSRVPTTRVGAPCGAQRAYAHRRYVAAMTSPLSATMTFRRLGRSGLAVSTIGIGCNNFGLRLGWRRADRCCTPRSTPASPCSTRPTPTATPRRSWVQVLEGKRDDVVLATKFGSDVRGRNGADWGARGSRRYIRRAVEASLRRLRTDHIDLYQLHRPDPLTQQYGAAAAGHRLEYVLLIGTSLALVFAGGAARSFVCTFIGARIGMVATVWLTEAATACGILAMLVLPLAPALAVLPIIGIALNGTSSVLYGSVPELVDADKRTRAFSVFYTAAIGSGALAPTIYGVLGDVVGIPTAMIIAAAIVLLTLPLTLMLRPALRAVGAS